MRIKIDFYVNENFKFNKNLNEAMTALLEEAKQTADKLNGMLRKLKNYKVESIQNNDRLHCTCVLKPGE